MDCKYLTDKNIIVVCPPNLPFLCPIDGVVKGFDGITFVNYDVSKLLNDDTSQLLKLTELVNKQTYWILLVDLNIALYPCVHNSKLYYKPLQTTGKATFANVSGMLGEKEKILAKFETSLKKVALNVAKHTIMSKKYYVIEDLSELKEAKDDEVYINSNLQIWNESMAKFTYPYDNSIKSVFQDKKDTFYSSDVDFLEAISNAIDASGRALSIPQEILTGAKRTIEKLRSTLNYFNRLNETEKKNYIDEVRDDLLTIKHTHDMYLLYPKSAPYYAPLEKSFSEMEPKKDQSVFDDLFKLYTINTRDKLIAEKQDNYLSEFQIDKLKTRPGDKIRKAEHLRMFKVSSLNDTFEFLKTFDTELKDVRVNDRDLQRKLDDLYRDLNRAKDKGKFSYKYLEVLYDFRRTLMRLKDVNKDDTAKPSAAVIRKVIYYSEALQKNKSSILPVAEATHNKTSSFIMQYIDHVFGQKVKNKPEVQKEIFRSVELCHHLMNLSEIV